MNANEAPAETPLKPVSGNTPESVDGASVPESTQERQAPVVEGSAQAPKGDPALAALPNVQLPATPVTTQVTSQQDNTNVTGTPLVAADDEVIEREWVEKAKRIVASTKDDPYSQEKEVGKLQADYLKKRYGKEVKLVGD